MGEVADALWLIRQGPEDRAGWIESRLADIERSREPVLLACALEPSVADQLIRQLSEPKGVLLATDAILQGAMPGEPALGLLVDHLVRLAGDPPTQSTSSASPTPTGSAWRYLVALSELPLPTRLRPVRDLAINCIEDAEQRVVATALAAGSDCVCDSRLPVDGEVQALEALFALPVPDREPTTIRRSRRHFNFGLSEPILLGRAEAALGAIRLVGLSDETATAAAQLAVRVGFGSVDKILLAIKQAGFPEAASKRVLRPA